MIIARYDGKCLTEAPFVKQYEVNAGETLHITENYRVENTDENTKVKVMLWQGLKTAVPIAKTTLMIGEYADGI